MAVPLKPSDMPPMTIPDEVIVVINELLLKKWNGERASISEKDIVDTLKASGIDCKHIWIDRKRLAQVYADWQVERGQLGTLVFIPNKDYPF